MVCCLHFLPIDWLVWESVAHRFVFITCLPEPVIAIICLRFGETDLHKCEVMLKDVADSKRLNVRINDELQKDDEDSHIPVSQLQWWTLWHPSIYCSCMRTLEIILQPVSTLKLYFRCCGLKLLKIILTCIVVSDECYDTVGSVLAEFSRWEDWSTRSYEDSAREIYQGLRNNQSQQNSEMGASYR